MRIQAIVLFAAALALGVLGSQGAVRAGDLTNPDSLN